MPAIDRRAGRGFAYLVLLLWLAIGGAMLSALGSHWSFEARREREIEFVFRAEEYRRAIDSYSAPVDLNGCSNLRQLPTRLQDLVDDRRCGLVRHHLRRLYADPLTRSSDWGLVVEFGGIRGVYSLSGQEPLRHVDGVKTYRDWRFLSREEVAIPASIR